MTLLGFALEFGVLTPELRLKSTLTPLEYPILRTIDVGQGDAILIEIDTDRQILIDVGPSQSQLVTELRQWLEPGEKIELLVISHLHADHLGGLEELLQSYGIDSYLVAGNLATTLTATAALNELTLTSAVRLIAEAGQTIDFEPVKLTVLAPPDSFEGQSLDQAHEATIVLRVEFESQSALLTGDLESDNEAELLARYQGTPELDIDYLKVSHHGSQTSTNLDWLAATTPEIAAISIGRLNRYGHPHQATLDRLREAGVRLYRTDQNGTISTSLAEPSLFTQTTK
ncbi:MAG: putative metallo-beta-lactamase superfamily hydrolase [Candidatus Berkelbacteria bacterium Gr01-1014_85]|uniref:Putative metallo-beta-lactamase superfamily hydrolase n=1 Tax=Candidatus Berkelbacteria bacterium Gr01-1014_85 TaxID=2017150 RepID=A0A554JCA1_9BACT|nr:MAG: putative metallo-beta-lactamase superfamily hydrolase [Candidatus Berkelbacteria bacterium Gr01-1014_85]